MKQLSTLFLRAFLAGCLSAATVLAQPSGLAGNTLKIIEYDILDGMKYDHWQGYAGFINWVRLQDPDILVLCGAENPAGLASLAQRWSHAYTAFDAGEGKAPVLVTSRYPLELVQPFRPSGLYANGGMHLRVAGLNLVAFQGMNPSKETKKDPKIIDWEEQRHVAEIAAVSAHTICNPLLKEAGHWILTGSFRAQSPTDSLYYSMRHLPARFDAMRTASSVWPHDIVAERLEHAAPGGRADYGLTTAGKPNLRIESSLSYGRGRFDYFLCDDAVESLVENVRMIRDPFTFFASTHLPLEVILRLPDGVTPVAPEQQLPPPVPVEYAGDRAVPAGCLKMIDYNILYGMVNDQANHYDNFVAWVKKQAPDILTLCEGRSDYYDDGTRNKSFQPAYLPDSLAVLARRWGHEYVFVGAYQDDHPVLVTSKYPITPVQKLEGPDYKHGGLHVKIRGLNVVATHTTPFDKPSADGKSGPDYRRDELKKTVELTLQNPAFRREKYWLMAGDLNSVSPADSVHYRIFGVDRSYIEQEYLRQVFDHDVIYDWYGGVFQPSVRHGKYRIDFIYTNNALYRRIVSARTIVDAFTDQYSDHLPVEIVFKDTNK